MTNTEIQIESLDTQKKELLSKVNVLVAKKKKLYSNMDIESPMSSDENDLNKDISVLFTEINQIVKQKRDLKIK